jgi:GNAT superfamily N-acetyltransferase
VTGHPLVVRTAAIHETDVVMQLLQQRIAWLRARGSDQWSTWRSWPAKLPAAIERHRVWLLTEDELPVGTVTADEYADPDFWTTAERADSAVYLAKLAVRPDRAGRGYGALLLDVAGDLAHRQGRLLLRLDAWKDNTGLHAYYSSRGWRHVRTVDLAHRRSGALFEKPAQPLRRAQQQRVRWAAPTGT